MNNYEIGYMKPPRETRFKPGQSGNKLGRPKSGKNTYKLLDDLLNQRALVMKDGKDVKINKKTAILLQAVNSAAKGNIKALQMLLPHMLAVDARNESLYAVKEHLSTDDQKIIEMFLGQNKDITKDEIHDESSIESNIA